jgi:hypothetical protein
MRDRKYIIVTIIMLLSHGINMYNNWRPGGTGLGWTWMWLGNRAGLWLHFVPPVSIKDSSLYYTPVRSQTYYPEHILVYGSGKTCYSLVMVLALFGPTVIVDYWVGGLSTTLRPDL